MRQEGYVTEICGDMAKIRVDRESSCGGNCVSCKGCPAEAVVVECKIAEEIEVGDRVALTMPSGRFLGSAALGYGILTALAICGAALGYALEGSEGASVLGAIVGIATGLVILRMLFPKNRNEITVTKID